MHNYVKDVRFCEFLSLVPVVDRTKSRTLFAIICFIILKIVRRLHLCEYPIVITAKILIR